MQFPKLYAIANLEQSGLAHVERLLAAGAPLIQLRAKSLSAEELLPLAEQALRLRTRIMPAAKIVLNDRAEIAKIAGADGVHLGQEDSPPGDARALLGPSALIGLSTHTIAQLRRAPFDVLNYVAFGPVFQSPTKSGHAEVTGLDLLREATALCPLPLVAIGGITAVNAADVFACGAASVAVISDLERRGDLAARVLKYLQSD